MEQQEAYDPKLVRLETLQRTYGLLRNAQEAKAEAARAEDIHRATILRITAELDALEAPACPP